MTDTYVQYMKGVLNDFGHLHVHMDDGTVVEVSKGNTQFHDDYFKVDDGTGYPDAFPYDAVSRIEIPSDTTE